MHLAARYQLLLVEFCSGIQSHLSFGGFGSLTRHLGILSAGIVMDENDLETCRNNNYHQTDEEKNFSILIV
jgi:hypothetical protein